MISFIIEKIIKRKVMNLNILDTNLKAKDIIQDLKIDLDTKENTLFIKILLLGELDYITIDVIKYDFELELNMDGSGTNKAYLTIDALKCSKKWVQPLLDNLFEYPLKIDLPTSNKKLLNFIFETIL